MENTSSTWKALTEPLEKDCGNCVYGSIGLAFGALTPLGEEYKCRRPHKSRGFSKRCLNYGYRRFWEYKKQ